MKNLNFIILILLVQVALFAQKPFPSNLLMENKLEDGFFSISGTLYDQNRKEPIIFGCVTIYNKNQILIGGVETNLDGEYSLHNIKPGSYILEGSYIGYENKQISEILIIDKNISGLDIHLTEGSGLDCYTICISFDKILIDISNPSYITSFTSSEIANQYKTQNNSWNLHFTIHEKKKEKKKKKRKKKSKIKESSTAPDLVPFKFDEVAPVEKVEPITVSNDQQKAEINIFPNPSIGLVNIESSSPITNILTFNSQGQLVNQFSVQSEYNQKLDLSSLAAGLYYIHILHEGGNLIQQITILD